MKEKLKTFYNKSDLNLECDKIKAEEFHTILYILIKSYDLHKTIRRPWWRNAVLIFEFTTVAAALVFIFDCLCTVIQNPEIVTVTELGMYALLSSYELFILFGSRQDRMHYYEFQKMLEKDFRDIYYEETMYKKIFFETQLNTWKVGFWTFLFTYGTGALMAIFPFIWFLWILKTSSEAKPLIFPFSSVISSVDYNESPYFEIAFSFQSLFVISFIVNYNFLQYVHMILIGHIFTKANVILSKIEHVMDGVLPRQSHETMLYNKFKMESRMKEVVKLHHSLYKLIGHYSSIYKKYLMMEQFLSTPVWCLSAFAAAERWDIGEIHVILIALCLAAVVQILIPCYVCTIMGIKVQSIGDACYDMPIWNGVSPICKYILLVMQRSGRPLPLHFSGMMEVNLETFSKKMSTAYSFFNMLRQTKK